MKQVAILHTSVPPTVGPVETLLYHHIRLLSQAGYPVQVIGGMGDDSYYEAAFHHQVDFFGIPEISPAHPRTQAALRFLEIGQLNPLVEEIQARLQSALQALLAGVDVCIVHNVLTSAQNLLLTSALQPLVDAGGRQWIAWCHEVPPVGFLAGHPGPFRELLARPWPGVRYVADSPGLQAQLAANLGLPVEAVEVIPAGVDVESFAKWEPATSSLVDRLDLLAADPLFLWITPLTPDQPVAFVIRTLAALKPRFPHVAAIIAGEPEDTPANQAALKSWYELRQAEQVANQVNFLFEQQAGSLLPRPLSESILSDLYSLADALISSDLDSGLGQPAFAAGLARMPIFTLQMAPVQERLAAFTLQINPQSAPETAAQFIAGQLSEHPAYRLRRRILEGYTWPAILKHHLLPLLE